MDGKIGRQTQQQQTGGACSPRMKKRIIAVGAVICGLLVPILIGSLFNIIFLAEHNGKSYAELALDNQLRDYTIPASRGTIYDRTGKVMAQNATVWTVDMYPSEFGKIVRKYADSAVGEQKAEETRNLVADKLSQILSLDRDDVYGMTKKDVSYINVKRKVEKEQADLISTLISDNKLS